MESWSQQRTSTIGSRLFLWKQERNVTVGGQFKKAILKLQTKVVFLAPMSAIAQKRQLQETDQEESRYE